MAEEVESEEVRKTSRDDYFPYFKNSPLTETFQYSAAGSFIAKHLLLDAILSALLFTSRDTCSREHHIDLTAKQSASLQYWNKIRILSFQISTIARHLLYTAIFE